MDIKYNDGVLWFNKEMLRNSNWIEALIIGRYIEPTYDLIRGLPDKSRENILLHGIDYSIPSDECIGDKEAYYFVEHGTHREDVFNYIKHNADFSDGFINMCIEKYPPYIDEIKNNKYITASTITGLMLAGIDIDVDFDYDIKNISQAIGISRSFKLISDNMLLDKFVTDKSTSIRQAVAEQGYGLDILINDEIWYVRAAVAEKRYRLDILVNDTSSGVRCAVARQGYGLDILVNDKDWRVRKTVAKQGYGLDVLVNDPNANVRRTVAEQGYGLDVLINDPNESVRRAVAEQGYGLDILINDTDNAVKMAVISQGYGLDIAIKSGDDNLVATALEYDLSYLDKIENLRLVGIWKINLLVRIAMNKWDCYCEELSAGTGGKRFLPYSLFAGAAAVQSRLIKEGYVADAFLKSDVGIRCQLAQYGEFLSVLVRDSSSKVRVMVAKQGYGLDILVNDKKWQVREEVARQGYGLDKLVDDPTSRVRRLVARQGYGLEKLINDPVTSVRLASVDAILNKIMNAEIEIIGL